MQSSEIFRHNSILRFSTAILKYFSDSDIFYKLKDHSYEQSPLENHRVHLIKLITEHYFKVRFYYISKKQINKAENVRTFNNKMTLFKGH